MQNWAYIVTSEGQVHAFHKQANISDIKLRKSPLLRLTRQEDEFITLTSGSGLRYSWREHLTMCGIAGYFAGEKIGQDEGNHLISRMLEALAHRGLDG